MNLNPHWRRNWIILIERRTRGRVAFLKLQNVEENGRRQPVVFVYLAYWGRRDKEGASINSFPAPIELILRWPFFMLPLLSPSPYAVCSLYLSHSFFHLALSVLWLLNIQTIHKIEHNVPDASFARTAPKAFPLHRSLLPNLYRVGTTFATGSPLGTDSFYVYYPPNSSTSSWFLYEFYDLTNYSVQFYFGVFLFFFFSIQCDILWIIVVKIETILISKIWMLRICGFVVVC